MIYNDKHRTMGILSSKKPQKNNLLFTPQQINPKRIVHQKTINITEMNEEKNSKNEKNDDLTLKEQIDTLKEKESNNTENLINYEIIDDDGNLNIRKSQTKRNDSISKSPNKETRKSLELFEENFDFLVKRIQEESTFNKNEEKQEKIKNIKVRKRHSLIIQKTKTNELILSKNLIKVVEALEDEAKALTNIVEISNFYDYTNLCFEQIHKILKENDINTIKKPNKVKIFNPGNHKKLAVFDLDETLIHAVTDLNKNHQNNIITIRTPTGKMAKIAINIRPKWEEVIKKVSKVYTIVIYTASHSSYANGVLDFLDPENRYFYNRLYRNNCIVVKNNGRDVYIKDLSIFEGFDLKNILIIDNSVLSFAFNLDNGIPILPYYDSEKDVELSFCGCYLVNIAHCDNLMEVNKKYMKLDYYLQKIEKENDKNEKENDKNEKEKEKNEKEKNKKNKSKRMKKISYDNASILLKEDKKIQIKQLTSFDESNLLKMNKFENENLQKYKFNIINEKIDSNDKNNKNEDIIYENEKVVNNDNKFVVIEIKNNFEKLRNEFTIEDNKKKNIQNVD